jgi:hypothetical protein
MRYAGGLSSFGAACSISGIHQAGGLRQFQNGVGHENAGDFGDDSGIHLGGA